MQLAMKGATNSVLAISKSIYREGRIVPITEEDKEKIRALNEGYSKKALRVLAIAFRPLEKSGRDYTIEEAEKDVVFLGLVCMTDPPKEGVKEAVASCHDAHIRIIIMTGDHAITAQAVGKQIGLSREGEPPVYTGSEMEKMNDVELTEILSGSESVIFSRVAPEDKLRIVKLLQAQDEVVAVTGDGVNDAPALKRAAIGVAMGMTGTDVAKEAAELILLDDSFPTLVEAVREGRTIYNNLKKTVIASMTTNVAELVVVLLGLFGVALWNWAIPILAIQILAIDLLAEVMPLTFLTFDPPSEGIMKEPPRDLSAHIMNLFSSAEVIFLGTLIGILAFGNFALYMSRNGITLSTDAMGTPDFAKATTLTYMTVAYCQFVNIMSRREELNSIFSRDFFTNRILLGSIGFSIFMVFIGTTVPAVRSFLYFYPPSTSDFLYILMAAAIFLGTFEVVKAVKRSRRSVTE
jgi:Ca2+-transporting ATPase